MADPVPRQPGRPGTGRPPPAGPPRPTRRPRRAGDSLSLGCPVTRAARDRDLLPPRPNACPSRAGRAGAGRETRPKPSGCRGPARRLARSLPRAGCPTGLPCLPAATAWPKTRGPPAGGK